jgi:hypothetical protein
MVMSNSITVQFDDGTSHVYEDVPDGVDEQQIKDRAFQDYAKEAVSVKLPQQKQEQVAPQTPLMGPNDQRAMETTVGGLQTAAQVAGQAATSPLGHIAEIGLGGKYAIDKLSGRGGVAGPVAPQPGPSASIGNATWDQALRQPNPPMRPTPPTSPIDYASKIVKNLALSKLLMPAAQVAANTYLTSPDEVATLKAAEAKKRAQGWKPLNER